MERLSHVGGASAIEAQLCLAKHGDSAALGKLIAGFRDYLVAIAQGELDPALRAKLGPSDVVQDTYLLAQRGIEHFAGSTEAELKQWLRQILLNRCRDLRDAYFDTAKRDVRREFPLQGAGSVAGLLAGAAVDTKTPSRHAMKSEQAAWIMESLQTLPDDMREAIWLRNWECLSFDEIGRRLGKSSEAARKLFSRGVRRLGDSLSNGSGAEPRNG